MPSRAVGTETASSLLDGLGEVGELCSGINAACPRMLHMLMDATKKWEYEALEDIVGWVPLIRLKEKSMSLRHGVLSYRCLPIDIFGEWRLTFA